LRSQLLTNNITVVALEAKVEEFWMDVITQSEKDIKCDQELYKRINENTK
jgi:hypothetical protein